MANNPRQRRLRKFWASDPKPSPGNEPPKGIAIVYAGDPNEVLDWVFTFGSGHHHPLTGEHLMGRFVRVRGTWLEARRRVLAAFGQKWSMQYRSEDEAGVAEYDLVELPESEWPQGGAE